jgi:hypothetical protein
MFGNASTATTGSLPTLVLGQSNFVTCTAGVSQAALSGPTGITGDGGGNIWVSDINNSRVLLFSGAASGGTGQAATTVLGQSSFVSNATAATASGMNNPWGVALDATGALWVADRGNNRVLAFSHASSLTNGAAATLVLGQTSFVTATATTTQSGMNFPYGVAPDASGNLFVADTDNQRVLMFSPPFSNGMLAVSVVGQSSFTTNTQGTTATKFAYPTSVVVTPSNTLLVNDINNSRVLGFPSGCAMTAPPHGTLGTCPAVLASGATCQIACSAGYNVTGAATTCQGGTLAPQTCAAVAAPAVGFGGTLLLAAVLGALGALSLRRRLLAEGPSARTLQ